MATKESSAALHDISSAQSRAGPKPIISVTKKSQSRHYQFKVFKSKGAIITLIWCFCSLLVYRFMMRQHKVEPINGVIVINMVAFLYPILGWLGDVHFGRYKMIKCSVWLMWFASLLSCFSSILYSLKLIHGKLFNPMRIISSALAAFGLGGMFTNAIPFGFDQLIDASSSEITSFIRWFCWVWYLGGVVIHTSMDCICHQYELASHLLLPVCLSFALCIDFFFNGLLTKEPTSKNPLTLIFRVLKYAIKNKYPRQRSAFAYWDSQRCSRINLGKNKYGGPFSTEEVESVKTFWRIMGVVTVITFIVGLIIHMISLHEDFMNHFQDDKYVAENKANGCDLAFMSSCLQRRAVLLSGSICMVMFIPLFEFTLYPIFKRYFDVSIMTKFFIGTIFSVLGQLGYMSLELIGHHQNNANNNITCLLSAKEYEMDKVLPLSYKWIAIPDIISCTSYFMLLASGLEFLCAHSPHNMKGLLYGAILGLIGFFTIFDYGLLKLVERLIVHSPPGHYGCGTWYLLSILILHLIAVVSFFCIYKWYYWRRQRNESLLRDEQVFMY